MHVNAGPAVQRCPTLDADWLGLAEMSLVAGAWMGCGISGNEALQATGGLVENIVLLQKVKRTWVRPASGAS